MSEGSSIEWTDATWQPTTGCNRVSPGCGTHEGGCYAERLAYRLEHYLKQPKYAGTTRMTAHGPRWTGKVNLHPSALTIPLHWRAPKRIFVDSMSDLFHEAVPDAFIDRVFGVMNACEYWGNAAGDAFRWHTFQVLTKRSRRMRDYLAQDRRERWAHEAVNLWGGENPDPLYDQIASREGPPPHIWCGVSAEDQASADERVADLVETRAAVRFVSFEPLLGGVDPAREVGTWETPIGDFPRRLWDCPKCAGSGYFQVDPFTVACPACRAAPEDTRGTGCAIHWAIVGSESGPKPRAMDEHWARVIRDRAAVAGVSLFYKQRLERGRKVSLPLLDGVQHAAMPREVSHVG